MATTAPGLSRAGQAVFGSLCLGTGGLGVWQTQRYFEKQDLVEQRNQQLAARPQPWNTATARELQQKKQNERSFQRFIIQNGRWNHDREVLVGPRGPPMGALPDRPGSSAAGLSSAPQGYYVLTPLEIEDNTNDRGIEPIVWVNRGWVPRTMVMGERRMREPPQRYQQSEQHLLQWTRHNKVNDLVVVPSKPEQPKKSAVLVAPQHDWKSFPPRLFWFDAAALQAISSLDQKHTDRNESPPIVLVTAIRPENASNHPHLSWPLSPPASSVGEFYVTPAVHVGYAFTWYSLSVAGMYMVRQMMKAVPK